MPAPDPFLRRNVRQPRGSWPRICRKFVRDVRPRGQPRSTDAVDRGRLETRTGGRAGDRTPRLLGADRVGRGQAAGPGRRVEAGEARRRPATPPRRRPARSAGRRASSRGRRRRRRSTAAPKRHAQRPAEPGEQHRLDEELQADVAAGGAERPADADLGPPFEHRDDHDVGDADAADQQGDRPRGRAAARSASRRPGPWPRARRSGRVTLTSSGASGLAVGASTVAHGLDLVGIGAHPHGRRRLVDAEQLAGRPGSR